MANCLLLHIISTGPTVWLFTWLGHKHIHCVNLSNHPLPYTTKCRYHGHIIINKITDDDIARQKRCLYVHANALV